METYDGRKAHHSGRMTHDGLTGHLFDRLAASVSEIPTDRRIELTNTLDEQMLTEDLRSAIVASGRSAYSLGIEADIRPEIITRFLLGQRDMRLDSASKIAAVLGLKLTSEFASPERTEPKPQKRSKSPRSPGKRTKKGT